MSDGIACLCLSKKEILRLESLLKSEGVSSPIILRDHRKRGPIYWSLIFDAAKNAPEIFGLPPLKMVNFKGIYLVDSENYRMALGQIAKKLGSVEAIRSFTKAKKRADAELELATEEMKRVSPEKCSDKAIAVLVQKFYDIRYPYTQYSFFFDTITKSVDQILKGLFRLGGFPPEEMQLAYVPNSDTIEFVYLDSRNRFLKKHSAELKKFGFKLEKYDGSFLKDLEKLMDEFADMNFVNFAASLESKESFLKKIAGKECLSGSISRLKQMKEKKQALLKDLSIQLEERAIGADFVEEVFEFAGNLSAWESKARHTWTRLHRAARPLIEEIGKRASEKGIISKPERIFERKISEIIQIAKRL